MPTGSTTRYIAPKSNIPRPSLPWEHSNPQLQHLDSAKALPVKFQEISREGHVALVGRMKIPTPSGHAFILRRLDTDAISLTTMFRAAFPAASDEAERAELTWIKNNYDLGGANKSGRARFAGTWANVDVALAIADTYSISHLLPPLIEAVPDPAQTYSKEKRAQQKAAAQPLTPQPTPPSPKSAGPNKRRKESTPQPPARVSPPPVTSPRRSTRLKSPVPATVPLPLSPRRTPKAARIRHEVTNSPTASTVRFVDEETETAIATEPDMMEDIQEQRDLIEGLKAQRAAKDQDQTMQGVPGEASTLKRTIAEVEPPMQFDVKGPEVGVRAVATNSRIRMLQNMGPERKSLAWGIAAFAAGVGAVLLPNWWL